jgi:molybdopterin-guanine dinucleotide biosynthesis protein A
LQKINSISAVIFAGGKSSRMGRDKSLLPFGEFDTMVEYQHKRLSKMFEKVFISWKSEKVKFGAKSILDNKNFSNIFAPTVGLYSILESSPTDYTFIISVDSPFFCLNNIEKLVVETTNNKFDIIIANSENGVEPLIGIYHKRVISKIKDMIESNNHKLKTLLETSNTKYVDINSYQDFINLNYLTDYEKFKNIKRDTLFKGEKI